MALEYPTDPQIPLLKIARNHDISSADVCRYVHLLLTTKICTAFKLSASLQNMANEAMDY